MSVTNRNNVVVKGKDGHAAMLFAHGFGCDQNMWRLVTPAFEDDYQVVLFDHVGAGKSDLAAYSTEKYGKLEGYAEDIVEIGKELGLKDAIFVGHSVSAMIGVIAAGMVPGMFKALVLVGPSPCYIDEEGYRGGFSEAEIEELLESLDSNHFGWSMSMAPVIMGNPDRGELGQELAESFCRTDPEIAKHFARTTFLSDYRESLGATEVPSLILQCSNDVIAPLEVGEYVHSQMKNSTLVVMKATGHCPNLSAPEETIEAIKSFL
ncbi:MAG: alpha/beta fold hydrolase [Verrucomicrobiaceae bacterium]